MIPGYRHESTTAKYYCELPSGRVCITANPLSLSFTCIHEYTQAHILYIIKNQVRLLHLKESHLPAVTVATGTISTPYLFADFIRTAGAILLLSSTLHSMTCLLPTMAFLLLLRSAEIICLIDVLWLEINSDLFIFLMNMYKSKIDIFINSFRRKKNVKKK